MKKWECNVCGYIHEGEEPPETCPVCGADKSAFVLISNDESSSEEKAQEQQETQENTSSFDESTGEKSTQTDFNTLKDKIDKAIIDHHLHPIAVHIPNGVIPVAVFLLLVGSLFNNESLINAAYYNITLVFLFIPVVLYTGYIEWIYRYKKALTGIFKAKIYSAAAVAIISAFLSLWKSFSPEAGGAVFLLLHIVLLGAAGIAGHIGGKFIFKK
ncbi:MAG: rubredoxin-like domain-containing protein [Thermodesulfobacteriota bacterium]